MNKRRIVLLLGLLPAVAVGVVGCTTSSGRPQVQDLSVSRNSQPSATYTVKAGDTIYGIAWQNRVDFRDLAQMNGISPPYRLQPGQQLRLKPNASVDASQGQSLASSQGAATVTPLGGKTPASAASDGENPSWLLPAGGGTSSGQQASTPGPVIDQRAANAGQSVAANTGQSQASQSGSGSSSSSGSGAATPPARQPASGAAAADTASSSSSASMTRKDTRTAAGNDAGTEVAGEPSGAPDRSDRTYKPVENVAWQWPTEGRLIGRFDDDSSITPGIDIAGQKGQPVKAAGPGIVVYAGDGVRGYGNLIILKHNDRFLSAYAHNDTLRVKENDVVKAGETIATMGQTDADQVELHFEVRVNGQPQDPLKYLPKR
ncbi:peptidoglycan DD-metalloendopeptidase family protein [Salinicola sp. DM10]|uniref:peptidoglycan DD-metalloendopeptidase family protein n=1 Tax=Salinicola sp. DM10 TaxID=2815721 RepID=UPI001A8DDF64|nr:peptidoglycan DD-metalloendopeptidase family protein [Salinicola sp. DM10]MCE3027152.1 peptidoglycan DD-metalloendopeptidase family protein [Salinicola sp. DM10]